MTLAENLEVLNLRAIAGEYDIQERHIDWPSCRCFLENQEKGNYTVHLDPALNGADVTIHFGNALQRTTRKSRSGSATRTSARRCRWASTATS